MVGDCLVEDRRIVSAIWTPVALLAWTGAYCQDEQECWRRCLCQLGMRLWWEWRGDVHWCRHPVLSRFGGHLHITPSVVATRRRQDEKVGTQVMGVTSGCWNARMLEYQDAGRRYHGWLRKTSSQGLKKRRRVAEGSKSEGFTPKNNRGWCSCWLEINGWGAAVISILRSSIGVGEEGKIVNYVNYEVTVVVRVGAWRFWFPGSYLGWLGYQQMSFVKLSLVYLQTPVAKLRISPLIYIQSWSIEIRLLFLTIKR